MASFEDFFARKYEELESENERLRDELESRSFRGYGVRPGKGGIDMVKVDHVSSYNMPDTSAALEELIRHLENGDNFRVSSYHSAVEVQGKNFPWTFDVVMPGKVMHYAVDGDGGVVDYDTMCGEWDPEDYSGAWVPEGARGRMFDWSIKRALGDARNKLDRVREREAESGN